MTVDATGVAVVTGASRGIGRAVAVALAQAGFDVVATMRDPAAGAGLQEAVAGGPGSISVTELDVCRPETIHIPEGTRVLVNNAGTEAEYLPVEHVPMDQWRRVFETNVFGLIEVTRRAIPVMRAAGGGVICNVTSSSLFVAVPFYGVYRASKAAVEAMGESLRSEVTPFGIRVIEVMPGPVESDMLAASLRLPEAAQHAGYEGAAQAMLDGRKSVEHMTTPAAVAAAAIRDAILADDPALRWPCDPLGGHLIKAWQDNPEVTMGLRA